MCRTVVTIGTRSQRLGPGVKTAWMNAPAVAAVAPAPSATAAVRATASRPCHFSLHRLQ
jgi:hypothetical protein